MQKVDLYLCLPSIRVKISPLFNSEQVLGKDAQSWVILCFLNEDVNYYSVEITICEDCFFRETVLLLKMVCESRQQIDCQSKAAEKVGQIKPHTIR